MIKALFQIDQKEKQLINYKVAYGVLFQNLWREIRWN